jgi:hypothetical protein
MARPKPAANAEKPMILATGFVNGALSEYAYYSNVISSSREAEYNFFIPVSSTGIVNSGPETRDRGERAFPARYQDGGRKWQFA